jgi:HlyD family secretion protein
MSPAPSGYVYHNDRGLVPMQLRFFIVSLIMLLACGPDYKESVDTCIAKKGVFQIDVVENGELFATKNINISSPAMSWHFGAQKITKIVEDGTEVSQGDTVVLLDETEVQKAIIDAEAELEIAKAELEKKKAEQESKIYDLEAELKKAELSFQISKIEFEQATFEAEVRRKEIQLNLEKAQISLAKAREEIENQKKIHKEELYQSRLKIEQLKTRLDDAHVTLDKLTVVSPGNGIAILRKNWSTGNKWQVGDQPWSGTQLISLPDLSELKVKTEINEVDISKLKINQQVEIRLDAFADTVLNGKVIFLATLAKQKDRNSKIKVFPVEILVKGTSKKLMPGMTVSCRILVDTIENMLYIPLEALFTKEGKELVYLKDGGSYKICEVETGLANNDYIIIENGIEEGDVLALVNPFEEDDDKKNEN